MGSFLVCTVSIVLSQRLAAADKYWDGGSSSVLANSGTWNTAANNKTWNTSATGGSQGKTVWAAGDSAFFGTVGTVTTGGVVVTVATGMSALNVTFGNMADTTSTITLTGGSLAASGTITNNRTAAVSISTALSGAGALINNAGLLTLSGANSYTGTTTLTAGVLRASGNSSALGAGALALSGGVLELANDTGLSFGRNTTVSGNATITSDRLTSGAGVTHSLGTLSIGANSLTISRNATVTSGTAGITFGSTTLTASGASFLANAGTLLNLGSITGNTFGFTVGGAGNINLNGAVSTGTGGLTKTGVGTVTLSAANTFTGVTTISGGVLSYGLSNAISSGAVTVSGGELALNSFSDTIGAFTISSGLLSGTGTLTGNSYSLLGGTVAANLGGGNMTVSTGATVLSGTSASSTVTFNSGVLTLGASERMSDSAMLNLDSGGVINLANHVETVASIFGSGGINLGAAGSGLLSVGGDNSSSSFSGVISGDGSATGGIIKTGTGTLALTGTNTFLGNIKIFDGTLLINTVGTLSTPQSLGQGVQGGVYLGVNGGTSGTLLYTGAAGTLYQNVNVFGPASVIHNSGSGMLDIHGTVNIQSGALTIDGGTSGITVSSQILGSSSSITTLGMVNLAGGYLDGSTPLQVNGNLVLGDQNGGINQTVSGLTGTGTIRSNGSGLSNLEVNLAAGSNTFTGIIGGASPGANNLSLSKKGSGTLILAGGASNTYTGLTNVDGGILSLAKLFGNAIGADLHIDSGRVEITASEQIADTSNVSIMGGSFGFSGSGHTETVATFSNNGGSFTTGANALVGMGNSIYWSGGDNTISAGGSVQDAHYLITGGTNLIEGGVSSHGSLVVTSGGNGLEFGGTSSPSVTLNSSNSEAGRILLNGNVSVLNTLTSGTARITSGGSGSQSGFIDLQNGARTFTVSDGSADTDLLIDAEITNGSLIKYGAGTLELGGVNSYDGYTIVNSGTLLVNGSLGDGDVTIGGEGLLSGDGMIGGDATVYGALDPGENVGTLSFSRSLLLTSAATSWFTVNVSADTLGLGVNDLVTVQGNLILGGVLNLKALGNQSFTGKTSGSWTLFTYQGSLANNSMTLGATPSLDSGYEWLLDTSVANTVRLSIVPEPTAAILGLVGVMGMSLRRRRDGH